MEERIKPKEEILDILETKPKSECEDYQVYNVPKKQTLELCNSRVYLDKRNLDQHIIVNKLVPIKTETILSKDVAELQKMPRISEERETTFCSTTDVFRAYYMKSYVKWEPSEAEASLLADCSNTNLGCPQIKPTSKDEKACQMVIESNQNKASTLNKVKQQDKCNNKEIIELQCKKVQVIHSDVLNVQPNDMTSAEQSPNTEDVDKEDRHIIAALSDHTYADEKVLTCNFCFETFVKKNVLALHMRSVHTEQLPFFCKVCHMNFTHKYFLNKHLDMHRFGYDGYSCNLCGKKYARKNNLYVHIMRSHSGVNFSCDICHLNFVSKRNIIMHMKTHNEKKYYSCELCQYKSIAKANLKRHINTHVGKNQDTLLLRALP